MKEKSPQPIAPYPHSHPPHQHSGPVKWIFQNFLTPWYNALLSALALGIVYLAAKPFWIWGVRDAAFGSTAESCQGIKGACWSFIADMWPVFLVGPYPYDQRWRVLIAFIMLVSLLLFSFFRKARGRLLTLCWLISPIVIFLIIHGSSSLNLSVVPTSQWGGLLLTFILSIVSMIFAFPISILLALGRQSDMPVIRSVCVGYIELIRGVPLITILFMASVVLPLFFPAEMEFNKVVRALAGITMFFSAYLAENIRGGLQGIDKGQFEAADALGMSYWKKTLLIVLPQALRIVIPPMVNNFIGILKDTSLVGIVGLVDLLQVAFSATSNPKWMGKIEEAYVFVAIFYWIMCYSLSRYSRHLEEKYQFDNK